MVHDRCEHLGREGGGRVRPTVTLHSAAEIQNNGPEVKHDEASLAPPLDLASQNAQQMAYVMRDQAALASPREEATRRLEVTCDEAPLMPSPSPREDTKQMSQVKTSEANSVLASSDVSKDLHQIAEIKQEEAIAYLKSATTATTVPSSFRAITYFCPAGHKLQPHTAQGGTCDKCNGKVVLGDQVMDCRRCNWYLCKMCA